MISLCSLFSGSSGNSIYIESDNTKILIDCGVSGKRIAASLATMDVKAGDIDAIFVTHEHRDHTHAVGIMSRRYDIPIYANEKTWEGMQKDIGQIKPENRCFFDTNTELCIKDICVHPFSIPHDASDPVGYSFYIKDKKLTLATDIGHVNDELISHLQGSEMILIESNHDVEMLKCGSYPYFLKQRILGQHGHLSNEVAGELVAHLAMTGTSRFLLGHLSRENNFPQLAYQTVLNALESRKIKVGKDVLLDVADRDACSNVYAV